MPEIDVNTTQKKKTTFVSSNTLLTIRTHTMHFCVHVCFLLFLFSWCCPRPDAMQHRLYTKHFQTYSPKSDKLYGKIGVYIPIHCLSFPFISISLYPKTISTKHIPIYLIHTRIFLRYNSWVFEDARSTWTCLWGLSGSRSAARCGWKTAELRGSGERLPVRVSAKMTEHYCIHYCIRAK
jgi:hypothetical protein